MTGNRRPTAILAFAGVLVLLVIGLEVLRDTGFPQQQVQMPYSAAWLSSNQIGSVTLLDGDSADVVTQVPVGKNGDELSTSQQGADAYTVNRTRGTFARIDGATFTTHDRPAPSTEPLQIIPASTTVFGVDAAGTVITPMDPETLTGDESSLLPLSPSSDVQSAVDSDGSLWMLDRSTGTVARMHDDRQGPARRLLPPATGFLTLSQGRAALLDAATGKVWRLDTTDQMTNSAREIDFTGASTIVLSGGDDDRLRLVDPERALLTSCPTDGSSCSQVFLGSGARDLGAALPVRGRLFVPDFTAGLVWIVNELDFKIVARAPVLPPATEFELVERGGFVFFNDPQSAAAGVVDLDGTVRRTRKYESRVKPVTPATPQPAATPSRPPSPNPSRQPTPHSPPPPSHPQTPTRSPSPGRPPIPHPSLTATPTSAAPTPSRTRRFPTVSATTRPPKPSLTSDPRPTPTISAGPIGGTGTGSATTPPRSTLRIEVHPGTEGLIGTDFHFRAQVSGGDQMGQVRWNFGDGVIGEGLNATHAYTEAGRWSVQASATVPGSNQVLTEPVLITTTEPKTVQGIACGQTVTENVVLTEDLDCGRGPGITVGKDGVTVDLNDHSITGAEGNLLLDFDSRAEVTLRNGTLRKGVVSRTRAHAVLLTDLTLDHVDLPSTQASPTLRNLHMSGGKISMLKVSLTLTDSTLTDIDMKTGFGTLDTHANTFINSSIEVAIGEMFADNTLINTMLKLSATPPPVRGNTFRGGASGILLEHPNAPEISGNHFFGTDVGIRILADSNYRFSIRGNDFHDAGSAAVLLDTKPHSEEGVAIISDNTIEGSGTSGTELDSDGHRIDDGIHINNPASPVEIARNTITDSADHAIEAYGNITDGGGNTSSGSPQGCLGVACP